MQGLFNAVLRHPARKLLGPAATLISRRWRQAAGESPVGSASALHSISTYSLSLCLLSANPGKPQNQLLLSIISVFPRPGVKVGFFSRLFFFFYRRRLPLRSSSSHVVLCGSRYSGRQQGGGERVNISQSCHTVRLGRLLMRGAWRSFLGVGGRGQTVSVSVSAYAVICSWQFPLSLKCSLHFGGDVASHVPTHLRRSLLVGCGSVCR